MSSGDLSVLDLVLKRLMAVLLDTAFASSLDTTRINASLNDPHFLISQAHEMGRAPQLEIRHFSHGVAKKTTQTRVCLQGIPNSNGSSPFSMSFSL